MSNKYKIDTNQFLNVEDEVVRDTFRKVNQQLNTQPFLRFSGRLMEIEVAGAATYTFPHGLTFIPKDVLQLFVSNSATITWNHDSFTEDLISYTSTAACTVRAFVGRFD